MDNGQYLPATNLRLDIGPADEPRDDPEPGTSAVQSRCNWCGRLVGCPSLACRGSYAEQAEWVALATVVNPHPDSWMAQQGRTGRTWAAGMWRDHDGRIVREQVTP